LSVALGVTGQRIKRVEEPGLLTGQGASLDDLGLPGLRHAAFAGSIHAHALIRSVDLARARSSPGVAAALSGRDLVAYVEPFAPRLEGGGFWPTTWSPLAPERARFVGEAVGRGGAGGAARAAGGPRPTGGPHQP